MNILQTHIQNLVTVTLWLRHKENRVNPCWDWTCFYLGVGGSADSWQNQLTFFSSLGYEVIAPDLLGHGFSSTPGEIKLLVHLWLHLLHRIIMIPIPNSSGKIVETFKRLFSIQFIWMVTWLRGCKIFLMRNTIFWYSIDILNLNHSSTKWIWTIQIQ